MRIRTFATIMSAALISIIGITNMAPADIENHYCVEAEATRSHRENSQWLTDYTDEHGNIWQVYEDSRPEIRPYTLVISDNGTPTDITDDIVENII